MSCHDPKCEELARDFLSNDPLAQETEVLELAAVIQTAIEDWWGTRTPVTEQFRLPEPILPVTDPCEILDPNPRFFAGAHDAGLQPGNLQISGPAGDPIVTIHHDGRVVLNSNFPLDAAAHAFWDAVIRLNPRTKENA